MKVFWITAHPEPRSLNGFLKREGQKALRSKGHQVEESDLYAMRWNPVVDAASYGHDPAERLQVAAAAKSAHANGTVSSDIRAEQEKLDVADTIVLQFPMWWFGMPALLKGWFDRVWHQGYAYGRRGSNGEWIGYGDGFLVGKRAMLVVTMGGPAHMFSERGIHGSIDDLLFPIHHGMLFYAGAEVLSPVLVTGSDRYTAADAESAPTQLRERLDTLQSAEPLQFRTQNGGDYENFMLRSGLSPVETGLTMHRAQNTRYCAAQTTTALSAD